MRRSEAEDAGGLTPAEEMAAFFASRLSTYEDVHMRNWGELHAHIADFFDDGLESLPDIGCGTGLFRD